MGCCFDGDDDQPRKRSRPHRGRCTDCLCFIIFIIFLAGMGIITALTVLDNGFNRLRYGYDSSGNVCNNENNYSTGSHAANYTNTVGLSYVFFFSTLQPFNARKLCVRKCPDENIESIDQFENYTRRHQIGLCGYDVEPGVYDSDKCPKLPIYRTFRIANRCVPDIQQLVYNGLIDSKYGMVIEEELSQNQEFFKLAMVQLYENLPKVGLLSLASLLATIILVFLLRYMAALVIYMIMIISILGSLAGSAFLWKRYYDLMQAGLNTMTTLPVVGIEMKVTSSFLLYALLASFLTLILILIIFTMRKRIGLVIKLIAEAQKTLADMPMLFILPLFAFAILIMFLVYWCVTAMMIYSFGEFDTSDVEFWGVALKKVTLVKIMWTYHFIALIWVIEFIFAAQAMIISGAVAKWYFTRDKDTLSMPICSSIKRTLIFHMGSVAFGSFIITLIRFPRYVLIAIQNKMKASGQGSLVGQLLKAFTCCLWVLENVMQFINSNAYTIIAIEGVSFCTATKKSFLLITKNILRIAMINTVGDFLLLLCKLSIASISVVLAMIWLQVPTDNVESLKMSALPLITVALIAFLIAHCFFTVYEMVIDALMICFCEDTEANDGTPERPYFMSKSLKAFVDASESTTINIGDKE